MIVDDAAIVRINLRKILEEHGYEITAEAADGDAAVKYYKTHLPDLVIMDITMPKRSGLDAVKNIVEFNPDAKILMCSAMGQESMVKESYMLGAKGFIVKPFEEEIVVSSVAKLIGTPLRAAKGR